MELAKLEKMNKLFFTEKRIALQNKKNEGHQLTDIEDEILTHLNDIKKEEDFWERNRNL